VESGAQPLTNSDNSIILTVNGEIYNHMVLRKALTLPYSFKTHSDCEVIIHLYNEIGDKLLNQLDGIFAFVLYDVKADRLIAARDPIGVTTLYYGYSSKTPQTIYFSSEMKALHEDCDRILSFPLGHMYDSVTGQIIRW
jgi:asparagine synthase (glutamine-hydrolysing)